MCHAQAHKRVAVVVVVMTDCFNMLSICIGIRMPISYDMAWHGMCFVE